MSRRTARAQKAIDPVGDPIVRSANRLQAMADGLDQVRLTMERRWDINRLRLLVRRRCAITRRSPSLRPAAIVS